MEDTPNTKKENILLFGVGKRLYEIIDEIIAHGYNVLAAADNDSTKQGESIAYQDITFPVISPTKISEYQFDKIIVTLALFARQYEVNEQLLSMGIPAEKIGGWELGKFLDYPVISGSMKNISSGKLYFDVSIMARHDDGTGIQRVVNNLYRNMTNVINDSIIPIRRFGVLLSAWSYRHKILGYPFDDTETRISLTAKDKLLAADFSLVEIDAILQEANLSGTETYTIVYDLLPIFIPDKMPNANYSKDFLAWIRCVLSKSDHVLCISRTVADDVIAFYRQNKYKSTKPLKVHYFHLGFDLPTSTGEVRAAIKDFAQRQNVFLMVGTIEPRKNHILAMQALRRIWQKDKAAVQLLIIGRDGWKNEGFKSLIQENDVREHVLWIGDASDAELAWAYQNTTALLYPSQNEGYGLPIVEAAHYHLPIICSDIPILHELSGENATYFTVDNVDSLAQTIETWLQTDIHPDASKIKLYSWQESAQEVLDILSGQAQPYVTIEP